MAFIEPISESQASGAVAKMYAADRDRFGYLPNFTLAFSHLPEAYAAWLALNGAIKASMDLRRYELATVAAARQLRSSYCTLAHGSVLIDQFLSPDSVRAVVNDHRAAGLEPVEVAVMDLADKVASDATSVTQEDIDGLRGFGLTDGEILEVVLAAAARAFFSKTLDGLGIAPDARYAKLQPDVRQTLTVGRAIADP